MISRFVLLWLLLATPLFSCVCSGNGPSIKETWNSADAVFLGTVELASPDADPRETQFQEQEVRVRVESSFKGVTAGQIVVLHQGGTDCDPKFRTGDRAVFYLSKGSSGALVIPWCTRAPGSANPAGDDLLFLGNLPKSAIGTRLSGSVDLYGTGAIAGVRLAVSGPSGFSTDVLTNSAGVWELYGLSPGVYSVAPALPVGTKLYFPIVSGSKTIPENNAAAELQPDGAASIDFFLRSDTRLTGHVRDAKGQPLGGVCFRLEPTEKPGDENLLSFVCSHADGQFEMEMMPAGKYWLVGHDDVITDSGKSRSTLYYPGVRDRNRAIAISVDAGRYRDLDVQLPDNEQRHVLAGHVLFADGKPAEGVAVIFTAPESAYSEVASTGPDGAFRLFVIAGVHGQLTSELRFLAPLANSCPGFGAAYRRGGMTDVLNGTSVTVAKDSEPGDIKLEIPSASCKAWPPELK